MEILKIFGSILNLGYTQTLFHIMSDNFNEQKGLVQNKLKPKAPFKWVFMYIIPSKSPESLTSGTTFSTYILIVDA